MKVCIFCGSSQSKDPQVEVEAKKAMNHFAQNKTTLVYGGAAIGVMGTLANELINHGGEVIGIIPRRLMKKEVAHGGLTQLHVVADMHERKKMMYDLSDAFLVFPGGMGTLDEMFEILTWAQLGIHNKPIALLNVNGYYDGILSFLDLAQKQGLLSEAHRKLLYSSTDFQQIWNHFNKNKQS